MKYVYEGRLVSGDAYPKLIDTIFTRMKFKGKDIRCITKIVVEFELEKKTRQ